MKRPVDAKVWRVEGGKEPASFTTHFHAWYPPRSISNSSTPNLDLADSHLDESHLLVDISEILKKYSQKYTYDDLINRRFPEALDTSCLEVCFRLFYSE